MTDDLLRVFGLVLIVEALLPFVSPRLYRETATQLSQLADRQIRLVALGLLVAGLLLLKLS